MPDLSHMIANLGQTVPDGGVQCSVAENQEVQIFAPGLIAEGTFEAGDCNAGTCTKSLELPLPDSLQDICDATFPGTVAADFVTDVIFVQAETSGCGEECDATLPELCTDVGGTRYSCIDDFEDPIPTLPEENGYGEF